MRRTYLVTVDEHPENLGPDETMELAIQFTLYDSTVVSRPVVALAPDSFQPINKEGNAE